MKILFKEEQKFTQWWLWLLLSLLLFVPVLLWYERLSAGKVVEHELTIPVLFLFSAFIIGLILLFYFICLRTEIDADEIRMQFFPLLKKRERWEDVKIAKVVDYGFVGGWGIRLWTRYGIVYNVKGSKGLAIELKNGKKFLIGTRKEAELKKVLENFTIFSTQ